MLFNEVVHLLPIAGPILCFSGPEKQTLGGSNALNIVAKTEIETERERERDRERERRRETETERDRHRETERQREQ